MATTKPAPSTETSTSNDSTTTPQGAFPLTANNLSTLLTYVPHPSGLGLTSLTTIPAGTLFTPVTAYDPTSHPTPHTLQTSATQHIHLLSALNYLNHSCSPSLEIDTQKMEVRVAKGRELREGDALTFFYPSTEWRMDGQFECLCGGQKCLGMVKGAEDLSREDLEKGGWFVNEYIWELVKERDEGK